MTPLLTVEKLSKYFSVKAGGWRPPSSFLHAVDDVSFSVAPGEALGLVGESGSGKSTLVDMLAKLSTPTSGRIVFQGRDIGQDTVQKFAASTLRSRIQMVFQDAGESWNPRFTAFDAIAHPVRRLLKLTGEALSARVHRTADMVSFPREMLGRLPHQLSGGQRARIGIARAIAVEPSLLILDEPTSALDISIQAIILQLLGELRKTLGITYIFVSHDLNVVRLLCDRIIIMYLGQCVEAGSTEQIFLQPRHPYTACLIDGIPGRHPMNKRPARLTGDPRSPVDPDPNICRFFGRCPRGRPDVCAVQAPAPRHEAENVTACHFPLR
jgi:oligopeptide/dipeptide ABC transporter ATP-binding protein